MTGALLQLRSPKRAFRTRSEWFRYYASYSELFVRDMLRLLDLPRGSAVADPWNGAGTTTFAAHDSGHRAYGFDVNPVMVLVAKARLLGPVIRPSHLSLAENIVECASEPWEQVFDEDPLEAWFIPSSARWLRRLEQGVQRLLVEKTNYISVVRRPSLDVVSPLAAFFYTALFRTVRELLRQFQPTNPTWIVVPPKANRIRPDLDDICVAFLAHVSEMAPFGSIEDGGNPSDVTDVSRIAVASSESLPIGASSIDAVITSPPYCTRIDYAVATKPELALLGLSMDEGLVALRRRMIGTPMIVKGFAKEAEATWGPTCNEFLNAISSHRSRASSTYYRLNHIQYFRSIYASMTELKRVLKTEGSCVVVAQDSYYKEVHNDLQRILLEMGESLGWTLRRRWDFPIVRTMASVNQRHQKYRRTANALESVLWFSRN